MVNTQRSQLIMHVIQSVQWAVHLEGGIGSQTQVLRLAFGAVQDTDGGQTFGEAMAVQSTVPSL